LGRHQVLIDKRAGKGANMFFLSPRALRTLWKTLVSVLTQESCVHFSSFPEHPVFRMFSRGVFDFFVVLAALVDLCIMRPMDFMANSRAAANGSAAFSAFRVLQLFRLARIFQLLRLSHELSSLAFNLAM